MEETKTNSSFTSGESNLTLFLISNFLQSIFGFRHLAGLFPTYENRWPLYSVWYLWFYSLPLWESKRTLHSLTNFTLLATFYYLAHFQKLVFSFSISVDLKIDFLSSLIFLICKGFFSFGRRFKQVYIVFLILSKPLIFAFASFFVVFCYFPSQLCPIIPVFFSTVS